MAFGSDSNSPGGGGFGAFGGSSSYGGSDLGGAAQGSRSGNGNGGGSGSGGNNGGNQTSAQSSMNSAMSAAPAAAVAGADDSKQQGGIMSGLMSDVAAARGIKSSESAAPEAARAGKTMSEAALQGAMAERNAGITKSAFSTVGGVAGGIPGTAVSAVGEGIGKVAGANPYGKDSLQHAAFESGKAEAKDAGLGSVAKGGLGLLGGILGGPLGAAAASLLGGGISAAMQTNMMDKNFPGISAPATSSPSGPVTGGTPGSSVGGNRMESAATPGVAPMTAALASPFEYASDYDKERDVNRLNLTKGVI